MGVCGAKDPAGGGCGRTVVLRSEMRRRGTVEAVDVIRLLGRKLDRRTLRGRQRGMRPPASRQFPPQSRCAASQRLPGSRDFLLISRVENADAGLKEINVIV